MDIRDLQANWNEFGKTDALYAILTYEGKENSQWNVEEFFSCGKKEIEQLMNYLHALNLQIPRRKALDFGCGVGRLTQALAEHFDEVCAVDIAPSMIELARKYNRYEDKCKYYVNDADDLSLFPEDSFDLIYSNITLQHIAPRHSKNYIREFVRILSPSGLLIFQLPCAPHTSLETKVTLKQRVKLVVPVALLGTYHKVRYGGARPIMQMYAVKKAEIVELLRESGGEVVEVIQEPMGEDGWESLRYCVRKNS